MKNKLTVGLMVVCLTLQACSSRPREFTPRLAAPLASQSEFDAAYATCQQLLVAGKLDSSGRAGSAGAGAAAGAATAVAGGAAATSMAPAVGAALASATVVLLPFAILGGAWGMSRMKRAKKERAIKTALEGCLQERGYEIAGWSKGIKKPVIDEPASAAE
ncbi:MAG: hypothetical protein WKF52_06295 [Sphingomicrobium sp.]